MTAYANTRSTSSANIIRIAIATALILLVPLVAMLVTDEAAWGPLDFAVAGALLFGIGVTYDVAARKVGSNLHRAAIALALAAVLMFVWAQLAVGVFGD